MYPTVGSLASPRSGLRRGASKCTKKRHLVMREHRKRGRYSRPF